MTEKKTYKVVRQCLTKTGKIRRCLMGQDLTKNKADALKRKCERKFAGKGYTFLIFQERATI